MARGREFRDRVRRRAQRSCTQKMCVTLGKIVLIVFNIIWVLIGLTLLVLGCLLKFAYSILLDLLKKALTQLGSLNASADSSDQFLSYFSGVAIPIICLGAFFFVIGFLGCCGACCKSKCLLLVYAIVVGIIVLAEIGLIIGLVAAKDQIKAGINKEFQTLINKDYNDFPKLNDTNVFSMVMNVLMIQGGCCGLSGKEEFTQANQQWDKSYTYDGNTYTLTYPLACCKMNGTLPNMKPVDISGCTQNPPATGSSNVNLNCWSYIDKIVAGESPWVLAIYIISILFQILLIIFAVLIYRDESK